MQPWILEADICRLQKALQVAVPEEKSKLKAHLQRIEAKLVAMELKT